MKLIEKHTLKGHALGITALAYNKKKGVIYSGSLDKSIKTWNLNINNNNDMGAPELVDSIVAHDKWITDLKYIDNGSLLISASLDSTIKFWKTVSKSLKFNLYFDKHTDYIQKIVYLEKSEKIISSGFESKTFIWDLKNFRLASNIEKYNASVISLAHSDDESNLFMGSSNSEIIIWDLKRQQMRDILNGQGPISDLKIIKEQNVLIAIDEYGGFYGWDLGNFDLLFSNQLKEQLYSIEVAYFNRSAYIFIGGTNKLHIFSFPIKETSELDAHNDKIISLLTIQVHKNINLEPKNYLFSGSLDKTIKIWEIIKD